MKMDALTELLDGLSRIPHDLKRIEVNVEWERDPVRPGRYAYRLSSQDRRSVEAAIDKRQREVEIAEHGGYANFTTPRLIDGRWVSLGEVVIYQQAREGVR